MHELQRYEFIADLLQGRTVKVPSHNNKYWLEVAKEANGLDPLSKGVCTIAFATKDCMMSLVR